MIACNILPVYPLDGYRIIRDFFGNKENLLIDEIIDYIGIIVSLFLIFFFYMYTCIGFVFLFSVLLLFNIVHLMKIKRRKKMIQQIMMYDILNMTYTKYGNELFE